MYQQPPLELLQGPERWRRSHEDQVLDHCGHFPCWMQFPNHLPPMCPGRSPIPIGLGVCVQSGHGYSLTGPEFDAGGLTCGASPSALRGSNPAMEMPVQAAQAITNAVMNPNTALSQTRFCVWYVDR